MSSLTVSAIRVGPLQALTRRVYVDGIADLADTVQAVRKDLPRATHAAPIALLLERDEAKGILAEIAFPVRGDVQRGGFGLKEIPTDALLSTVHIGPYRGAGSGKNLIDTVRALWAYIGERRLLAGDNPSRYVFHEGPELHGDNEDRYRTEIQISYHLPVWIDALDAGLHRIAGSRDADEVLAGADGVRESFDAEEIRGWVLGAVRRAEQMPVNEGERARVLQDCAHRYPAAQLERLRAAYDAIGGLRPFLERLAGDKELFPGTIWLDESGAEPLAYIQRSVPPWNREAYDAAEDPAEKRYHACFCTMVRDAIRNGEPVPRSFCDCSAGWYVQMWEAILDRRLRIDVVESVLRGDDRCLFAVHLPADLL
jgi:hypothetical protein